MKCASLAIVALVSKSTEPAWTTAARNGGTDFEFKCVSLYMLRCSRNSERVYVRRFESHERLGMLRNTVDDSIYCTSCNHALVLHSAVGCLGENFQCSCVRSRDEVISKKREEPATREAVEA